MRSPSSERGSISDQDISTPERPKGGRSACSGNGEEVNPRSRMVSEKGSIIVAGVEESDELGREERNVDPPDEHGEAQDSGYE